MGLSLSREAERPSSLVHAIAVGERSRTEAHAPRRRVRSAGIALKGEAMTAATSVEQRLLPAAEERRYGSSGLGLRFG